MKRLCFIHIGKTAGTSLVATLDARFPPDAICPAYLMPEIKQIPPEELALYRFFRGHFLYRVIELLPGQPLLMTILRHPVERARSLYQHVHHDPSNSRYEYVKDMTLAEYVHAPPKIRIEIDNWQTRVLTSTIRPSETPDLALAKQRLRDNFHFVGLTERYVESLRLLAHTLGWSPIREVKRFNQTPHREAMSPDIVARIREINTLDLELYAYATELFESRYARLPWFKRLGHLL